MSPEEMLAAITRRGNETNDPFALWEAEAVRAARDDITRLARIAEAQQREIATLRTEIVALKRGVAAPPSRH